MLQTISPSSEATTSQEISLFNRGGVTLSVGTNEISGVVDPNIPVLTHDVEVENVRGELLHFADLYSSHDPSYWNVFGFSAQMGDTTKVTSPSNSRLNEIRTSLVDQTGIHSGTFVDAQGGFIEPMEFARHLAMREIPMATYDAEFIVHDNLTHRPGYTIMCEEIFARFVEASKKAVSAKHEELAKKVVDAIDNLTAEADENLSLDDHGISILVSLYSEFMSPFAAVVRAVKDVRTQRRVTAKLNGFSKGS